MFGIFFKKKELEFEVKKLQETIAHERRVIQSEKEALQKKLELDALEQQTLLRLKSEQEMAQIKLTNEKELVRITSEYDAKIRKTEAEHAATVATVKADAAKEFYGKMQDAMKDIAIHGTDQGKFVQDLAMKMYDKALEKPMIGQTIHEVRKVKKVEREKQV